MYLKVLLSIIPLVIVVVSEIEDKLQYHDNIQLEAFLHEFHIKKTENITTKLYTIGNSEKGSNLTVLSLTAAPKEAIGVPNVKFVGTIHGNEPVGREILLYFVTYLRDNYHKNHTIKWLLEHTKIHILPNLNPDGFAAAYNEEESEEGKCSSIKGRNSKYDTNLNREFPDFYIKNMKKRESNEIDAVIKWIRDTRFILSAGLHGGAFVANYPFDTSPRKKNSERFKRPSLTPDDDVFVHLAKTYANAHPTMHKGLKCNKKAFPGGITNGADWYSFPGGMQDYNYAFAGCMELTLELSCCKFPEAKELPSLWDQNREVLVAYTMEAHRGVTGQILDAATNKVVANAILQIKGRNMNFTSSMDGEFWRLLLPGKYELIVIKANGYYIDQSFEFEVFEYAKGFPKLTQLTVFLRNSSISTTTTTTSRTTSVASTTTLVYDDDKETKEDYEEKMNEEPELNYDAVMSACTKVFATNSILFTTSLVLVFWS